jgi:aminomethyltransferase
MRTPLFDAHVKLGAKVVDFHGWDMPVWYTSIKAEHIATRKSCGIFDTSHMGEIYARGSGAVAFLNKMVTIDVSTIEQGQIKYTFLLNTEGGIIDDLTVYCIKPQETYMLCVNASNKDIDFQWLESHNSGSCILENKSESTSMLAVQGPNTFPLLKNLLGFNLENTKYYYFKIHTSPQFGELLISRTGYTGADGAEIFMDNKNSRALWDKLVENGATPCGLGARDTLRLEMGYPLHGNDIDEKTSPLEARLSFAVDLNKESFIGKDALLKQKNEGIKKKLIGIELIDKGVPRQGCICLKDNKEIGIVSSGSISPMLDKGIALCYLDSAVRVGDQVEVLVRDKKLKAVVKKPPFVASQIRK